MRHGTFVMFWLPYTNLPAIFLIKSESRQKINPLSIKVLIVQPQRHCLLTNLSNNISIKSLKIKSISKLSPAGFIKSCRLSRWCYCRGWRQPDRRCGFRCRQQEKVCRHRVYKWKEHAPTPPSLQPPYNLPKVVVIRAVPSCRNAVS